MTYSSSRIRPGWLRGTGLILGAVVGAFWLFFALASHGTDLAGVIEVLAFGAPILALIISAWRWPVAAGALLIILGLVYAGVVAGPSRGTENPIVFLLLPIPVLIAGILILLAECRRE